jgi:hypothetical protein
MAAYASLKRSRPIAARAHLAHPIMVAGEEVTELLFTRPTLGDLRGIDTESLSTEDIAALTARLAGINREEADAIDFEDLAAVVGVIGGFFGSSPASGAASP